MDGQKSPLRGRASKRPISRSSSKSNDLSSHSSGSPIGRRKFRRLAPIDDSSSDDSSDESQREETGSVKRIRDANRCRRNNSEKPTAAEMEAIMQSTRDRLPRNVAGTAIGSLILKVRARAGADVAAPGRTLPEDESPRDSQESDTLLMADVASGHRSCYRPSNVELEEAFSGWAARDDCWNKIQAVAEAEERLRLGREKRRKEKAAKALKRKSRVKSAKYSETKNSNEPKGSVGRPRSTGPPKLTCSACGTKCSSAQAISRHCLHNCKSGDANPHAVA